MRNVLPFAALVATVTLAVTACGSKPPPPPQEAPKPVPVATKPPPPPPPPPPKCESLDEHCKADADTKARIRTSGYVITPPPGWTYAQASDATVAQSDTASMAATSYDGSDPAKIDLTRDGAVGMLAQKLGVTKPTTPIAWGNPMKVVDVNGLHVSLWQINGAGKGTAKGPLLVFDAALPGNVGLLGAGFVPDDDKSDADEAILNAVKTISPAPAKSP